MNDLSTSLMLLLLALLLLWLAVTDRLSRLLDAWDVATGKATASTSAANAGTTGTTPTSGSPLAVNVQPVFHLPSLPALGQNVQVGIS